MDLGENPKTYSMFVIYRSLKKGNGIERLAASTWIMVPHMNIVLSSKTICVTVVIIKTMRSSVANLSCK